MSDYISRDELLELYAPDPDCDKCSVPYPVVRQNILDMPAADVIPVVYCKDCVYLGYSDFYGECSRGLLGVVGPMDYCSRGARRDKEDEHETD